MKLKYNPKLGDKYGQWTVISENVRTNLGRKAIWHVKCECGNEAWRDAATLVKGKTKACMSCAKTNRIHRLCMGYFNRIRRRAEKLNLDFDLTPEFLWNLYEEQNHRCSLSGILISFSNSWATKSDQTCSLDRINNSKGYTQDNVQWLHKDINLMKHTFNQNYFIELCKSISSKCV